MGYARGHDHHLTPYGGYYGLPLSIYAMVSLYYTTFYDTTTPYGLYEVSYYNRYYSKLESCVYKVFFKFESIDNVFIIFWLVLLDLCPG